MQKALGTEASPSAVTAGTVIGVNSGQGYGAGWTGNPDSGFKNFAEETFTNTSHKAGIAVITTPTGSVTAAQTAYFPGAGGMYVGSAYTSNYPTTAPPLGGIRTDGDIVSGGTVMAASEVLAQSTSSTVNTSQFGGANSVASNSISITNVVLGTYFDFELSGAGTPTVTTATCNWMGATPAVITSGKSSSFLIKGTGPNAGRCYILRENY